MCKPRCSKLEHVRERQVKLQRLKRKKLICVSGKGGLLSWLPVLWTGYLEPLQSWPPPAMKVKHTQWWFLFLYVLISPMCHSLSFILTQCTWFLLLPMHRSLLLGAHSLCLFKKCLKMCASLPFPWPPLAGLFTAALSGFHSHPVVSRLSSFFPCVAGPTALNMPDLDPSFTFHLMSHVLGSSSAASLQTLP